MPLGLEEIGRGFVELGEAGVDAMGDVADYVGALAPEALGRARAAIEQFGDLPSESIEFFADPKAYVRRRASEAIAAFGEQFADAAAVVANDVLDEVGLAPLADGVAAMAELVDSALAEIRDLLCVADNSGRQEFWALTAVVLGARAAGIVAAPADCLPERIVPFLAKVPATSMVTQLDEFADLLNCAVALAFKLPLPERHPTQHAVVKAGSVADCVYVSLDHTSGPPQVVRLGVPEGELGGLVDAAAYAQGWRFAQVNPVARPEGVVFDVVLERSSIAQNAILGLSLDELLSHQQSLTTEGWSFRTMRTYRDEQQLPKVVALLHRATPGPSRHLLVTDRTLKWWLWAPKQADAYTSPYYELNAWQRDRRKMRLLAIEEWPELRADAVHLEPLRANVVIGAAVDKDTRIMIGLAIDPGEFRARHKIAIGSGYHLVSMDAFTMDGRVQLAGIWHRPTTPSPARSRPARRIDARWFGIEPSPNLLLEGWRADDFARHFPELHDRGYRVSHMANYVAHSG